MKKPTSLIFIAALIPVLAGCSSVGDIFEGSEEKRLEGERISVLELQRTLEPDDATLEMAGLVTPPPWSNQFWPQAGGYPNHAMQNLALSENELKRLWRVDIGVGTTKELPLTAQPILVDGLIYTVDTRGDLGAINIETGKVVWATNIRDPEEHDPVIGGGLAFGNSILYATNGYDQLVALTPGTGDILWRAELPAPSRAAPTVLDGRVYVTTLDNRLLAVDATSGAILWEHIGLDESSGLVGAASAAANRDIVVPVFSSGEIVALRVENGSVAWSDNLSAIRRFGALSDLTDIKALPVLDKGIVFAISFNGRLVAIDARTGTRLWQREISGINTPWVAGNHLFVVSSDNQLIALGRDNGKIRWVTELPRDEGRNVLYTGPILAGGRLIVAGSGGLVLEYAPETGELIRSWKAIDDVAIAPIVAGETLYILTEDGTLAAYR